MQLLKLDEVAPADVETILRDLAAGDARFSGTTFGRGECSLETFLQQCRDRENPETLPPDLMPQILYWLADDTGQIVGMVRLRPHLNDQLKQYGGHIGYYVLSSERGKGYGTQALRLALIQLRNRGISRALLMVNPTNTASTRVILANGGIEDGQSANSISGEVVNRYWIDL